MDLPLKISLITYALEQEKEALAWELWKSMYPNMQAGLQEFISFKNFKEKAFEQQHKHTKKSYTEIENEMLAVVAKHERR